MSGAKKWAGNILDMKRPVKVAAGKVYVFKALMIGTVALPHGRALKFLNHIVTQLAAKKLTPATKLLFVTVETQKLKLENYCQKIELYQSSP